VFYVEDDIMTTLGLLYLRYWLNLHVIIGSLLLHLSVIKLAICVACKTTSKIMVPPLLDSYQLNIQFLFFKLTMSPNGEGIMARHFGLNSIFKLCKKINYFSILTKKINEHMKLVEIAMVQMKKIQQYVIHAK
jgi:hypothetical protein